MSTRYDLTIPRLSTKPDLVLRLLCDGDVPLVLGTGVLRLAIKWRGGGLVKTTGGGGLTYDEGTGDLTWQRTSEESLSIPDGRIARYTLEFGPEGSDTELLHGDLIGDSE